MRSARFHLLFLLLFPIGAYGQTATLRGFVTDAVNGEPMDLVNVVVRPENGGTVSGAVTSSDGAYILPRLEPGRYVLQATFVGYFAFRDTLDLEAGIVRTLNIALRRGDASLEEVLVEEGRTSGIARIIAGQQTIRPADVELVPSPDLSPDLASYLVTLPAVVTVGDRGGQLFIRGGEPTQNLILLDGIPVYQPFHMLGFYSAFPAEVLRSVDVYAGGFGARFGGRLSSVLDVASRNGDTRLFGASVAISPFVSAARVEGPLYPGRASFLASFRQSFLETAAEPLTNQDLPFEFGDAFVKVYVEPAQDIRLSVTGLQTRDRGTLFATDRGEEELRWINQGLGARLVSLPRIAPFVGVVQLSYARLKSEQGLRGSPARYSIVEEIRGSAVGTFFHAPWAETDLGVEFNALQLETELGGVFQNVESDEIALHNIAFFAEPELSPLPGLQIRPGVRFHLYRLDSYPRPEPRVRVQWEWGRHAVSAAAGIYHQEIAGVNDRRDASSVFTAWVHVKGVTERATDFTAGRLSRAYHGLLGYRAEPLPGVDVAVEGFYKRIQDVFVTEWTAYPRLSQNLQAADGRTFGFDARLALQHRSAHVQVTYGLSNTLLEASRDRYELWYGEGTLRFRPSHDRRHQVNALVGFSLAGFDLHASWYFGSGLPFSRALGFGGFILMDHPDVDLTQQGTHRIIYERPNNGILPTFHRFDASIERTIAMGRTELTLQASAINIYDRRNVFYLDVFTLRRTDQLPFVPSFGIRLSV